MDYKDPKMAATQSKLAKFSSPRRSTSDGYLVNPSMDFTDNRVNGEMHPAFENPALSRESTFGGSLARPDTLIDEGALFDSQQAFAEALAQYEKEADPKYKTGIDLSSTHTWEEVIEKVEVARKEYKGVDKEGTLTRIHSGLRNFHTAAPAIELWLKLLPSTSIYGSILCGGLTIILEVCLLSSLREGNKTNNAGSSAAWEASRGHLFGHR